MPQIRKLAGIGAIIGDIVGSPYEFDYNNIKSEHFQLFARTSEFTDDTVMTVAVAKALSETLGEDKEVVRAALIDNMTAFGKRYPGAGYGARFRGWLKNPEPYNSWGNGAAMRVSPVGWLFDNLRDVLDYARLSAEVSHNHPEGIKGAQAVASAIFLTRTGMDKPRLKQFIADEFHYDLSRPLAQIRPDYHHVESCQETVPEAITAYLEGNSFEDVLRKAVSLGGDSDTLAAIACSIAEAHYDVPQEIREQALELLDPPLLEGLKIYERAISSTA